MATNVKGRNEKECRVLMDLPPPGLRSRRLSEEKPFDLRLLQMRDEGEES